MSANYAVVFRTDGGDAEYTYIGIDAEPFGDAPSETLCKKEDLTEIILHPSDDTNVTEPDKPVFHVDGKTETGEHISGDVFPVLSDGTAVVELPDGDYTNTDLNSGLTTDITVDKDSSGNGAGNGAGGTQGNGVTDVGGTPVVEAQPEQVNQITVKTPDGTVILTDDTTGYAEDLNPDSLDGSAYFEYESVTGTANSVNDGERKEEHGYFVVKDGEITVIGDVLKGDVNLDGKVDVLDTVTAQKYLHQDKKLKFGVENYIAMDVHGDGIPNIYDFVTLKQMLLK
ncbi:MAG: dockerin type I repeat-containing protein [Ruminococcus sp.]|nr:dockerin type I repeat-containing protein [Ruminococcus sp.]